MNKNDLVEMLDEALRLKFYSHLREPLSALQQAHKSGNMSDETFHDAADMMISATSALLGELLIAKYSGNKKVSKEIQQELALIMKRVRNELKDEFQSVLSR